MQASLNLLLHTLNILLKSTFSSSVPPAHDTISFLVLTVTGCLSLWFPLYMYEGHWVNSHELFKTRMHHWFSFSSTYVCVGTNRHTFAIICK